MGLYFRNFDKHSESIKIVNTLDTFAVVSKTMQTTSWWIIFVLSLLFCIMYGLIWCVIIYYSLPKSVKRRIKALKKWQFEAAKIEADFYKEVHELECKYASKYTPLYEKVSLCNLGSLKSLA